MHIEETSDAVAGTVEIIETFGPEVLSCKRIDLKPRCTLRKDSAIDGNMALQDESVCMGLFRCWCIK